MALVVVNNSPSRSYIQKTVTLQDWWLTKPQTTDHTNTLGVAGLTSQQNRAARCFSSAPILKIYGFFELETVDGVCVILQGFINKDRTLENGFSSKVFDHFVIGFPPNWKEFSTNCPKRKSATKCVTTEDGQDSIEGHDDFQGKPQNCDSYTMDTGVQDNKDILLSNKTITPFNPPLVETPHEHKIKAGNEVLCQRSPVTRGSEDDSSLKTSPIVSTTVNPSTGSRCLGVSSRRITRSMRKIDNSESFPPVNDIFNSDKGTPIDPGILGGSKSSRKDINGVFSNHKKAVDVVDSDMKSESSNIISKSSGGCVKRSNEPARCSTDTGSRVKSKLKESDDIVVVVNMKDVRCGIANQEINKKDADAYDNTVLTRTNMKGCRNKKVNRVEVPQEGVPAIPATHGINSKEVIMTRSKSKTKLPVKRKLITSPKSTPSRGITRSKSKTSLPVKRKLITSPKSTPSRAITRSKSKTSLPDKRELITSPKSTPSRGLKGSEERYGSANILPLESFSGKKSKSGRVVLPPLEFWRNQMVVHDEDGKLCGVQEPK